MVLLLLPVGMVAAEDPPPFIGVGFGGNNPNTTGEEVCVVY